MKKTVAQMSTKELRKKLKTAELWADGSRKELEMIFDEFRKRTQR